MSSLVAKGMIRFRDELAVFLPFIKKVAVLTSADILPGVDGGFTDSFIFVGKWEHPEVGEYRKLYTRQIVFGRFLTAVTPRMEKRPCHEKNDLIKAILHVRTHG